MANESTTQAFTGLGTHNIGLDNTQFYTIEGKVNLPTLSEGAIGNSQVVVTVSANGGSVFYTGVAGAEGFKTGYNATAGDILNIILTSAAPVDQGLNLIKTTLSLY